MTQGGREGRTTQVSTLSQLASFLHWQSICSLGCEGTDSWASAQVQEVVLTRRENVLCQEEIWGRASKLERLRRKFAAEASKGNKGLKFLTL